MNKGFTIEEWLKASYNILKINWLTWVIISGVSSSIVFSILYFSFQEISPRILEIIHTNEFNKEAILQSAQVVGMYFFGMVLFSLFVDLLLIHQTSKWYSKTIVSIEESVSKALRSLPIAFLISILYLIMASFAMLFCFFPVIFVIVFFIFIFQALIIESKDFNSFGRSVEIVKSSFGNFMVIPFLTSFVFQIINWIPFTIVQVQFQDSISDFQNLNPIEMYELILNAPQAIYYIVFFVLFFSLQSNLKTILYTVAFEEGRKDRNIDKQINTDRK